MPQLNLIRGAAKYSETRETSGVDNAIKIETSNNCFFRIQFSVRRLNRQTNEPTTTSVQFDMIQSAITILSFQLKCQEQCHIRKVASEEGNSIQSNWQNGKTIIDH